MSDDVAQILSIIAGHRKRCLDGANSPIETLPSHQWLVWYAKQIKALNWVEDDIRKQVGLPQRQRRDDE